MLQTPPAPRSFGLIILTAVLILTGTAVWVSLSGAPLIWDGAYQLAETLIHQKPFVYQGRFHTFFLWQPTIWVNHFTDNLTAITFAYGFPFIIAPAVGLGLSWWIVKRDAPHLILWAVFGTAAAALPGQIFIINDSYFQQHLFWPVFLALFVPLSPVKRVVVVILSVAQLVHPIGMALCSGAAAAALIIARFDRERRVELYGYVGLMIVAIVISAWKLYGVGDPYAREEFAFWKIAERWHYGVAGWPIRGLLLMTLAAGIALAQPWWRGRRHGVDAADLPNEANPDALVRNIALVVAALAGFAWVYWARDYNRWNGAIDYRRWLVPLTLPFFLATLLDALHPRMIPGATAYINWRLRGQLSILVVVIFAAVLSVQSSIWLQKTRQLDVAIAALPGPIITWEEPSLDGVPLLPNSPLGHWGITSYVMLAQGKKPRKMLVPLTHVTSAPLVEPFYLPDPKIPLTPDGVIPVEPGPGGWFDNRPLLAAIRHSPPVQP